MADVKCARCDFVQPAPEPLGHGLRSCCVCPKCHALIVTELGEMGSNEDRADPDDWGPAWL